MVKIISKNQTFLSVKEVINISGDIKRSPIFTDIVVIDMKTCTMNIGVYQGTFKVYNNSSDAYAVVVTIPKCMRKYAKLFPTNFVVKSLGYTNVSVKFYPR